MINFSVFADVPVLVTGHTGFKGSWLYRVLEKAGARLTGLSLPAADPSLFSALGHTGRLSDIVDLRNASEVSQKLRVDQPRIIFHLAAQALVGKSYEDPLGTITTNVLGGTNLLEAARHTPSVEAIVFVTSDKSYENLEWEWGYRETDRLGGADPYSASKGAIEIVASSYRRSLFAEKGPRLVVARAGNVLGGGDWSEGRVVPDVVRAVEAGQRVEIRNPSATRPWQHVLEPLSGYLLLAEKLLNGGSVLKDAYNFGPYPGESRNVSEVVTSLLETLGTDAELHQVESKAFHEAHLLRLNIDRAQTELGWSPRWGFTETVRQTGLWYRRVGEGEDAKAVTDQQINEYFPEL